MGPRKIDLDLQKAVEESATIEVISEMLSFKADPNVPSTAGQSLLEIAMSRSDEVLCRLLLVYQANPAGKFDQEAPNSEASKLVRAWSQGDVPTVHAALKDVVVDASRAHDVGLLGVALASIDIAGGDAEQVAAYTDPAQSQNSLLHLCAKGSSQAYGAKAQARARLTARALLGWGVDVDVKNQKEETPLLLSLRAMHAMAKGSPGMTTPTVSVEPARALLEARANVEEVDPKTQESLLMLAARESDLAACQLLLDFGADPLRQNAQGKDAIRLSAGRHAQEVKLLLRTALVNKTGELDPLPPSRHAEVIGATEHFLPQTLERDPDLDPYSVFAGDDAARNMVSSPVSWGLKQQKSSFSLDDQDQEPCTAEGLLNQVDLEESYDVDWNLGHGTAGADPNWEESYDADWNLDRGTDDAAWKAAILPDVAPHTHPVLQEMYESPKVARARSHVRKLSEPGPLDWDAKGSKPVWINRYRMEEPEDDVVQWARAKDELLPEKEIIWSRGLAAAALRHSRCASAPAGSAAGAPAPAGPAGRRFDVSS